MNSSDRMSNEQIGRLALAIAATAEVLGQTITPDAAEMMADDLADYPADAIGASLKACRRELTGKLTLAAILQRIQASDGRPGKDEAWAIALMSSDETDTVVMTDEIQLALGAARPVLDLGDKVGARMAFISAYERLVIESRDEGKPVNWHVSIGFDANRRLEAITKAVQLKRIPQERGQLYLADLTHEPITADGQAIAGLLGGPESSVKPSAEIKGRIGVIKSALQNMRKASEEEKVLMRINAANDLADRLALLNKQVADGQNKNQELSQ